MAFRLHYFPESGNSYKLALMLTLCGESFDPVWVDFAAGVTRTAGWRASVNEMGELPVLEWDGARLTQTAPILLKLAGHYGKYGALVEAEMLEMLRWLFWDNHKLTGYMATFRYMRAFTPSPDPSVLAFMQRRLEDYLGILNSHLEKAAFVACGRPTVVDVSLCGYLCFPKHESGFDLHRDYPAVGAWLERIAELPGWRAPYELLPGRRLPLVCND
ncbi:glutathione S-transferase [Bradyrhizobium sp. USDA 4461]